VQKVIPEIARKSAEIVGKPVPPIDKTITKIMGILWIDSVSKYENDGYDVDIEVINYMEKKAKFRLYAEINPEDVESMSVEGKPNGRGLRWDIELEPTERMDIRLRLKGEREDYEDIDLYTEKVNPVYVVGAEPLPGDWNIEKAKIVEIGEEVKG
jgi:DNA topoisomerase-6 subunit B